MNTSTTNKPVATLRDGKLKGVIWKNPKKEGGHFYNAEIVRSYQDDQEQWHDSHSLVGTELLQASRLYQKLYDRIQELRRRDAEDQRQATQAA